MNDNLFPKGNLDTSALNWNRVHNLQIKVGLMGAADCNTKTLMKLLLLGRVLNNFESKSV